MSRLPSLPDVTMAFCLMPRFFDNSQPGDWWTKASIAAKLFRVPPRTLALLNRPPGSALLHPIADKSIPAFVEIGSHLVPLKEEETPSTRGDLHMKALVFWTAALVTVSSLAQPSPAAPESTQTTVTAVTNQVATTGTMFTNAAGQSYSAEQLAEQLRTLRSSVEQTLPVLSAFTESYSNSQAGKSLTGKLSDLVSGALNRG